MIKIKLEPFLDLAWPVFGTPDRRKGQP
ncbi:hypothetical protein B14911_22337 [Bacillus sp. NRRL B-14911]|nr:hypothetical protein B14911_22337 [Bacillus sp. NRRL B-14911]